MSFNWEPLPSEQRQHLNLSDHAFSVMESDIASFRPGLTPSGFVNLVIHNFWDQSEASIEQACERKRAELVSSAKRSCLKDFSARSKHREKLDIASFPLADDQLKFIELLVRDYRESLSIKMNSFPKGPSLKIRLQNEIYRMLYANPQNQFPELINYRGNQGKYIKAIFENYAEQPYLKREAIVFRENYEKLLRETELPAQERNMLTITLNPDDTGRVSVYDMKPYKLMTDAGANYHYIVGISRPRGDKDANPRPASIRLSRIDKIVPRPKTYASGKITASQRKELLDALKERGVPYLVGTSYDQKVMLTPNGVRQYNSILHMRPAYEPGASAERPDGSRILSFHCSNTQIKNYFLKFGPDAIVLEPDSLAEEFRHHHGKAFAAYNDVANCSNEENSK